MAMLCLILAAVRTRLAGPRPAGRRFRLAIALLPASLLALPHAAAAQATIPGGLLEQASSTAVRANVVPALPARGPFVFPAPYNTVGVRVTNAADCGGSDCVNYVGYSYWRNTNNHVGSNTMLIMVTLDRARGGGGPTLFTYDKTTDQVQNSGPIFAASDPLSWATGEGWYWSPVRPTTLYVPSGRKLQRYDVSAKSMETVFDITAEFGSDKYIWQVHTSHDDKVHSATLRSSSNFAMLGCLAYSEVTGEFSYAERTGTFDECQVDKSGRWLLIKENVDARYGEDNVIYDLSTGAHSATFHDQDGAAGHSDNGHGYMLAEDNWNNLPGAIRLWKFGQPMPGTQPQGLLVYRTTDWSVDVGHISHANARADLPPEQQYACSSHAGRASLPRANEIVCFPLDGSMRVLVVAPVMTSLDAAGGGDTYNKLPKGNLDVTGRYFIWTSNAGGGRLDAFVVKVPAQLLGAPETAGGTPPAGGDQTPPTVSVTAPARSARVSGSVTVRATAADNVGVVGVQFRLDGVNLGAEVTAAPYTFAWDTKAAANGAHNLTAVARDAAGNTTVSAPVPLTVQNGGAGSGKSIIWTNRVNVTVSGSTLRKTGGCNGCTDGSAVSVQQLGRSGGSVQFTAAEADTLRYVGLGAGSRVTSAAQMRFAIALRPGGVAEVRENGTYRTDVHFAPGDVFAFVVKGSAVSYYKNGALFHVSALGATLPLRVGASLLSLGSTVAGAVLRQE